MKPILNNGIEISFHGSQVFVKTHGGIAGTWMRIDLKLVTAEGPRDITLEHHVQGEQEEFYTDIGPEITAATVDKLFYVLTPTVEIDPIQISGITAGEGRIQRRDID